MQFGWRTVVFVILLLAMLVLSYPLLFKPLRVQRDLALEETQKNRQTLRDLAGALAKNKNLTEEIDNLQTAIGVLEHKLPRATEMDTVLQDIWQTAKKDNLTVKSVRNAKPVEGPNYNQQPIKMVIEGTFYPGFFNFLSQVEHMPRLTKISDMKITADPQINGAISADITMTIYYEASQQKVAVAQ